MHTGSQNGIYGIGFLVSKNFKNRITEFIEISYRIAMLKLQITPTKYITIVQLHAPTMEDSTEAKDKFYEQLGQLVSSFKRKNNWIVVMGDFNGRTGVKLDGEDQVMGDWGFGERNEGGNRIINFCSSQRLKIVNSFFKKRAKTKWTWCSPKGHKFELDYFLTNQINLVKNFDIINNFNFNTDHRMLRAELYVENFKEKRPFKVKNRTVILQEQTQIEKFHSDFSKHIENSHANRGENTPFSVQEKHNLISKAIDDTITQVPSFVRNKICKLSENTKELFIIRKRIKEKSDTSESKRKDLTALNNQIRKSVKEDLENHNIKTIENILAETKSTKKIQKELSKGKQWMVALENNRKEIISNRENMSRVATKYFKKLYKSNRVTLEIREEGKIAKNLEEVPPIMEEEVAFILKKLKSQKTPGPDNISNEVLKAGGNILIKELTGLFNLILEQEAIPQQWKTAKIILLYKKGNKYDIENYRPISLCSTMSKVFTSILKQRLTKRIMECIDEEQAGFRKGFSTIDQIQTVNQIIEKANEYNFSLYLCFLDFRKAFDGIIHSEIFKALRSIGIEDKYIKIITELYKEMTAYIMTEKEGQSFDVERGVRQGDPLSPILFVLVLEMVFWRLGWEEVGIEINGKWLSNLRFADDIVLFAKGIEQLEEMIKQLLVMCEEVGLYPNYQKTKLMTNGVKEEFEINNHKLAYVEEYIYLGQLISFSDRGTKEVQRRLALGWKKFWSLRHIMKGKISIDLKRQIFDSCISPVVTYGCQAWSLTIAQERKLQVWQNNIGRSIVNVRKRDRIKNAWIQKETRLTDTLKTTRLSKWKWAGHLLRCKDDRWSKISTEWTPYNLQRRRGRQKKRWSDMLKRMAGPLWWRAARDRDLWKEKWKQLASQ